ncbi:hypothetical protein NE237_024589 [Protea cynaroides]|uniref:BZIP domain-containing protein n=1 Tax=Protea cynaroides TaxID=273540 RepID=A0A9Q0H0W0_9MAGN|nr:hypothetical protein NE237_024589 [Protea cynaroides]
MDRKHIGGMISVRNPENPSIFSCNMKKSASELDLEEFLRPTMTPEIINTDNNSSLKEKKIDEIQVQRGKVCEDEEEANGFFAGVHQMQDKTFEDVCTGDLGFSFRDRNPLDGFSNSDGTTVSFLWSQNLNLKQSSILGNIESPSSIYAGSPVSANKPKSGDNQARVASSGSSREQSDDEELEAGAWEQSTDDLIDLKRIRRKVSNRESARRSRRRKQAHLADLELQVDQLRGENASLYRQLTDANQQFHEAATDNRVLKSNVEALRVKVKLAEDMVTRGTLNYSLNNLLQNRSVSPQPLNSHNLSCISEITPTSRIRSDDTSFSGMSINSQIEALGLENGDNHNGIIKDRMSSSPPPLQRIASLELLQNRIASDAVTCGLYIRDMAMGITGGSNV